MQDLRVIVEAAGTEDGMESGTWAGFGVGSGSGVKTGAIPWAGTKCKPKPRVLQGDTAWDWVKGEGEGGGGREAGLESSGGGKLSMVKRRGSAFVSVKYILKLKF